MAPPPDDHDNEEAGHDFAVLDTLVASCAKHGVNVIDYLTDVLTRVQIHPSSSIQELLPRPVEAVRPGAQAVSASADCRACR